MDYQWTTSGLPVDYQWTTSGLPVTTSAVAFTASAVVWPRAVETEIFGVAQCAIGAEGTLTLTDCNIFQLFQKILLQITLGPSNHL